MKFLDNPFIRISMMLLVAALLAFFSMSCTDERASRRALEAQGFTDIEITGWAGPMACSESDNYETAFTAMNPVGKRVSGVVCCGVFKSCTVRW